MKNRNWMATAVLLGAGALLAGCNSEKTASEPTDGKAAAAGAAHVHADTGPHGGQLIELGSDGSYHAELVHDEDSHRVTIHILDGAAKAVVPIRQGELLVNLVTEGTPRQFPLAALPQPGEAEGMASSFQSEDAELSAALDAPQAKGRLSVTIDGKQYVGEIAGHAH